MPLEGEKLYVNIIIYLKQLNYRGGVRVANKTWDERHEQDSDFPKEPASFLKEHIYRLPRGKALDLAMGIGRLP